MAPPMMVGLVLFMRCVVPCFNCLHVLQFRFQAFQVVFSAIFREVSYCLFKTFYSFLICTPIAIPDFRFLYLVLFKPFCYFRCNIKATIGYCDSKNRVQDPLWPKCFLHTDMHKPTSDNPNKPKQYLCKCVARSRVQWCWRDNIKIHEQHLLPTSYHRHPRTYKRTNKKSRHKRLLFYIFHKLGEGFVHFVERLIGHIGQLGFQQGLHIGHLLQRMHQGGDQAFLIR